MNWISLKDRFPPCSKEVLCLTVRKKIRIDKYLSNGDLEKEGFKKGWRIYPYSTYTHWMPLPSAPNNKEKTE